MKSHTYKILLVEDNLGHAELVKRCVKSHEVKTEIYHVSDGETALNYLFKRNEYKDQKNIKTPHIIFLDLRMPKIDGLEVLKKIKSEEKLKSIPVVILTTSESDRDLETAYLYLVNSYLVKPMDFYQFDTMIQDTINYWFKWNQNPITD